MRSLRSRYSDPRRASPETLENPPLAQPEGGPRCRLSGDGVGAVRSVHARARAERARIEPRREDVAAAAPEIERHASGPAGLPVRVEHEYERKGALNLFAAFDTRSGEVFGICRSRKRQIEFIELLEEIDRQTAATITRIHLICDNVSIHRGKQVQTWLADHPRFELHFTPVHCSWMNQVEQWFSVLQRKRFAAPNFADIVELEE